ncbi:hypothetical protein DM02DRAFT_733517 [Periconia macrospinosa]|uniref:Frequency clock protein n=1 Tax=Periconia macrospinosa TaxID=97972 RepID=A0A2V1D533_9PLEO|nr:hypothetical protein DM02DRAFT_733517 [Periconia macrospinosa]
METASSWHISRLLPESQSLGSTTMETNRDKSQSGKLALNEPARTVASAKATEQNDRLLALLRELSLHVDDEGQKMIHEYLDGDEHPLGSHPLHNDVAPSSKRSREDSPGWNQNRNDGLERAGDFDQVDGRHLDLLDEDLLRTSKARATCFIGVNSSMQWLRSLRAQMRDVQVSTDEDEHIPNGNTHGSSNRNQPRKQPRKFHVSDSTFYLDCDDLELDDLMGDPFEIPPPAVLNYLFDCYMQTTHSSFPILPTTFEEQFRRYSESLKVCRPYQVSNEWLAMLNLVLAISRQYLHLTQSNIDSPNHPVFMARATQLLRLDKIATSLPSPTLSFIQSLGLLSFYYLTIGQVSKVRGWSAHRRFCKLTKPHCVVKNVTMGDPPTMPPVQSSTPRHPRRPLAHNSVSLRHSPPASEKPPQAPTFHQPQPTSTSPSSLNAAASDRVNPPSSQSPKVPSNKHSSRESSDAGKWFESSNNNALQSNASFVDNDTPFFLRNSSSGDTPPDDHAQHGDQVHTAMPYSLELAHGGTDGSNIEEYRGVVDDLTVANKKLKQKLKKYEKLYDNHLQNEKLFEVRFHGLSNYKKKELEDTLQKFAAGLNDGPDNLLNSPSSSNPPMFEQQKHFSSNPSRFADSGYVSMSASGQNSSAPSNQALNQAYSGETDRRRMTKSQYKQQQQSIESYLHDITVGLLPTTQVPMTDKLKKEVGLPGNHSHPMQQEEVAQSAATADRQTKEVTGQWTKTEGHREARVMPVRADDEDITDQRPTRPLDIDPFRAQIPSENMEYIRHLGFTLPDMETGESPQLGHGWIYLNLLINMAQLHTFNVTPDFVKTAVTEYSSKFELSHDGRKIRWKGGLDETKNSSGSSSKHLSGYSPSEAKGTSTGFNNSIQTGKSGSSGSNLDPERRARRLAKVQKQKEHEKFTYTPIFFHEDSDGDEDFYDYDVGSSINSMSQRQQPGDSSGLGGSAIRSSSRKRCDDGPIIFYKKANFCTDLSGDLRRVSTRQIESVDLATTHTLGISRSPRNAMHHHRTERRRPYDNSPMDIDTKDGSQTYSSDVDIHFSPDPLDFGNGTESPDAVDFEASGVGGVHPADNFSIKVRRAYVHNAAHRAHRNQRFYTRDIRKALDDRADAANKASPWKNQLPMLKEEILSATCKPLPSSSLPPASFLPFDSTSFGDVDSDLDDDVSSNPSTTNSSEEGPIDARMPLLSPIRVDNQESSEE